MRSLEELGAKIKRLKEKDASFSLCPESLEVIEPDPDHGRLTVKELEARLEKVSEDSELVRAWVSKEQTEKGVVVRRLFLEFDVDGVSTRVSALYRPKDIRV